MKKSLFSVSLFILVLGCLGLFKPSSVEAAEGGPAGKLMLRAAAGPKMGQVTLTWVDGSSADNYHLVYGSNPKNMQYGVLNIGTSNVYTVGMLNVGTKYYFALVPVMNNVALYTSEWVSAWPMGGQTAMVTQPQAAVSKPMVSAPVWTAPTTTTSVTSGPVGKHWLVVRPGPKVGEVTLTWRHMDVANNYHLVYGTEHGKFKYGALNIGWVNSFTVRHLVPGKTYHFALVPVNDGTALYTTDQVMTWAKMNVQVVQTTVDAVMQPKPAVKGVETSVPLPDYPSASGQ